MQVTSGADWHVGTSGNRKNYSVALDDNDGEQLLPTWASMAWPQKYKALQKRADTLVVGYMIEDGAISREFGEQRLREIRGE